MTENTQELFGKLTENIARSNDKLMENIKSLVVSELKEVIKDKGDLKQEVKETTDE